MVKKGININLLELWDFESLGIKENLASKIIEERKLKGEFVNPEEIRDIVGKEIYSEILRNYNIYAVSKIIWERRITSNKYNLYEDTLDICFLSDNSVCLKFKKKVVLLGIDFSLEQLLKELNAKGLFSFISKPRIDAIFFMEDKNLVKLDNLKKRFNVSKVYSEALFHGREIDFEDFKIKVLYPIKEEKQETLVLKLDIGELSFIFLNGATFKIQKDILNNIFSSILHSKIIFVKKGIEVYTEFLREAGFPSVINYEKGIKIFTDGTLVHVPGKIL